MRTFCLYGSQADAYEASTRHSRLNFRQMKLMNDASAMDIDNPPGMSFGVSSPVYLPW